MVRPTLLRIPRTLGGLGLTSSSAAAAPLSLSLSLPQRSRMHHVAPLTEDLAQGVPDLFTPQAFNIAWTQYQTMMIQGLNRTTAGTEFETKDVKLIVLSSARDPHQAAIFNYASMAHNNHFFFKHLSPAPVAIPDQLKHHLEQSFGSVETLRQEMVHTAAAMFGPGFVWLVKSARPGQPQRFQVLTTYLAGSPYPGAHWRQQSQDMNTAAGGGSPDAIKAGQQYLANSAYGAGARPSAADRRNSFAPGGTDVIPVLCLNTWEHVWLTDYGIGVDPSSGNSGKFGFASKWWDYINWQKVYEESGIAGKELVK
ncbi:Manganese/iron superoxide dismutase [Bombardia bombarda]|uniref:Manganese/iron superoxide dismutase n=1 Tax=Bombardia bombarda TaxID=252184 RepID=A0AA39WMH3_9PEZI|nr:Manganese/iron superoxide dismutase [Bombardia bombarda]